MKRTVILWGLLGLVGGCESHSLTEGSLSWACSPTPAAPPKLNIARENL
ncbi:MAG: hypothetical protein HC890_05045 [Chloroflexaceae bacterium]|nr:hypothetical protein [Chloroflexaceae bacterium]